MLQLMEEEHYRKYIAHFNTSSELLVRSRDAKTCVLTLSLPAASPEILHHTVWRTCLVIAYLDGRWLYYQFALPHLETKKGWRRKGSRNLWWKAIDFAYRNIVSVCLDVTLLFIAISGLFPDILLLLWFSGFLDGDLSSVQRICRPERLSNGLDGDDHGPEQVGRGRDEWMNEWMNEWMDGWMDGRDEWMNERRKEGKKEGRTDGRKEWMNWGQPFRFRSLQMMSHLVWIQI